MTAAWLAASLALLPPLLCAVVAAGRGAMPRRLVAMELASAVALLLIALSFAFDQPSSIDLALTAALLSLPGMLVFALFVERWL
jgi:multicomponent Na+:H+ antiporter subunit F